MYDFEDTCIVKVIERRCYDGKVIPKVMHFVSFNRRELPFYAFVSVVSAVRFVQVSSLCLIRLRTFNFKTVKSRLRQRQVSIHVTHMATREKSAKQMGEEREGMRGER